jgi:hypothetical protein
VCLPAVVDLVLEKMHEQGVAPFGLYLRIAIDPHDAAKAVRRQISQTAIKRLSTAA